MITRSAMPSRSSKKRGSSAVAGDTLIASATSGGNSANRSTAASIAASSSSAPRPTPAASANQSDGGRIGSRPKRASAPSETTVLSSRSKTGWNSTLTPSSSGADPISDPSSRRLAVRERSHEGDVHVERRPCQGEHALDRLARAVQADAGELGEAVEPRGGLDLGGGHAVLPSVAVSRPGEGEKREGVVVATSTT